MEYLDYPFRKDCTPYKISLPKGKNIFEAWGGSGGDFPTAKGGLGGFTSGVLNLLSTTIFYVLVGGAGEDSLVGYYIKKGGCGSGGNGGLGYKDETTVFLSGPGGGGATTVYVNAVDNLNRALVSAGGGGGLFVKGGNAGGIEGESSYAWMHNITSLGANQTFGYDFGRGENGRDGKKWLAYAAEGSAGSGSGYYGGTTSKEIDDYSTTPGSGGSSYISGHPSCKPNSLIKFTDTKLLTGNKGNGYFRITKINQNSIKNCYFCLDVLYFSSFSIVLLNI